MRSDTIKKGIERVPHRALLYATGIPKREIDKPHVVMVTTGKRIMEGVTDFIKNR